VAIAFAGQRLGVPTTVVVPATTQPLMRDRIASYGVAVVVEGKAWDQADKYARALVEEQGASPRLFLHCALLLAQFLTYLF